MNFSVIKLSSSCANLPKISLFEGIGANTSPGNSGVLLFIISGDVIESLPEAKMRAICSSFMSVADSSSSLSTPLSTKPNER